MQTKREDAPPDIRATMKRGGISMRFVALPVGTDGQRAWAHVYIVPPKGTRVTRAQLEEDILPTASPVYVEIFTRTHNRLERRSTTVFHQHSPRGDFQTRWREPDKKRGLVVLISFETGNAGTWYAIPLDEQLRPIGMQAFGYSHDVVEPEYYSNLVFDQTDARGILKIGIFTSEDTKKQTLWYEWDKTGFVDKVARYFVIAKITKSRSEAEAFVVREQPEQYEIVAASDYKRLISLAPHSYAVVLCRFRERKQAEEFVNSWRAVGKKYTVAPAF